MEHPWLTSLMCEVVLILLNHEVGVYSDDIPKSKSKSIFCNPECELTEGLHDEEKQSI